MGPQKVEMGPQKVEMGPKLQVDMGSAVYHYNYS